MYHVGCQCKFISFLQNITSSFLNETWPGHLNLDRFNRFCTFWWKIWFSCTIAHLDMLFFFVTNLWLASVLKLNHVDIVELGNASKKNKSGWCLYRASLYYSIPIRYFCKQCCYSVWYCFLLHALQFYEQALINTKQSFQSLWSDITRENVWQVWHCWNYQCDRWPGEEARHPFQWPSS